MSLVRNAILANLQADNGAGGVATLATGGIFPDVAPQGTTPPFVVVSVRKGEDPTRVFQAIGFEEVELLVRATAKELTPKNAAAINRRVRARLDGAALTIAGYRVESVEWRGNIAGYPEVIDGETHRHEGSRIYVMLEPS